MTRIDGFMRSGGTVLFDTRDQLSVLPGRSDRIAPAVDGPRRTIAVRAPPPVRLRRHDRRPRALRRAAMA